MIRKVFGLASLRRASVAIAVLAGALLALGSALGGAKDSSSKVQVSVKADPPGANGQQKIQLTLTIAKGWHIYANPGGNPFFDDSATTVTIVPAPKQADISYPVGTVVKDAKLGDYRIYEGQANIAIVLRRKPNETGAIKLNVKVNACDENTCLLPGTIKIAVP